MRRLDRPAVLEEFAACQLGPDELRVLEVVAQRLAGGRKAYGEWNAATDQRDHVAEGIEELLDCTVYLAMRAVRHRGGL